MRLIRSSLRGVRGSYRRVRFRVWATRLRIAMWRAGGRLVLDAPHGCEWFSPPRIKALRDGPGEGGTLTLRIGRAVNLGRGTELEVFALGDNLLELRDNSYLLDDVHLSLRDGAICLGERSRICNYAVVKSSGEIALGADVTISHFCVVHCDQRIEIGEHCGIGERVTIVDSTHPHDGTDHPHLLHPIRTGPIVIGRNVFVGTNATITEGSTVADNAMIAAGSVLTGKDYPSGWLSAGAPAKPVRELSPAEVLPSAR